MARRPRPDADSFAAPLSASIRERSFSEAGPAVGIIMGSRSDWETMRHAAETLDELGVAARARIVSAHRTPDRLFAFAAAARGRGLKVIIAGAGGAAHLPGMAAAMTRLPVLGVPVEPQALKGLDCLFRSFRCRPDPGRDPCHRRARRDQRRASRGRDPGPRRSRDRRRARSLGATDRHVAEAPPTIRAMRAPGRCRPAPSSGFSAAASSAA